MTCRALAVYPPISERLPFPWDCVIWVVPAALPRGVTGGDALSALGAFHGRNSELEDQVLDEVRAVLTDSLALTPLHRMPGLQIARVEDLSPRWGIEDPVYLLQVHDTSDNCHGGDYSPWVPCDSTFEHADIMLLLRSRELVVAVSGKWPAAWRIRFALGRRYRRGGKESRSAIAVEDQTVVWDSTFCSRMVSAQWDKVPLPQALTAFAVQGVRTFAVDRGAQHILVSGRVSGAPICNALWDLLATYNLRAEQLTPTVVSVSAARQ